MSDTSGKAEDGMDERKWWRRAGSKLWYFFNSLKLTLFVLIALAAVSIIGTVVEQNKLVEDYLKAYGEKWTKVILAANINDMFHSWWFISLLAALTLNIIVCTFERFPPKWKSLLNHKPDKFDPRLIDNCSHHQTITVPEAPAEAAGKVIAALKMKKFKVMNVGGSPSHIYAWKGIIGRFGSDVTHISLLLILLGAIVGSFAGFKDFKVVYVGSSISVPRADFSLRLDKFWIDYYDSGQIKQYNSVLTVVENGKDVMTKQIWVNEPLYYKGIRFYQSSFGTAWSRVEEAKLVLLKKDKTEATVIAKWGELQKLPNSPYSVKLVGYAADFAYDERSGTVFSKSAEAENPAVNVEIYQGDKLISSPWLFMKYPRIFPAIMNTDYDIVFTLYRPTLYSGLSLNKDPGTNIVWAGTIVMGIGFILAFFVYHRRVWIIVRQTNKSSEIKIGGLINKNNFVFEKEIEEIVEAVTASGSGGKEGVK